MVIVRFNDTLAAILQRRGQAGFVFPSLAKVSQSVRGRRFGRLVARLKISGVTLHSYRYAWAERAKTCGFPERFAQEALGQPLKLIHHRAAAKSKIRRALPDPMASGGLIFRVVITDGQVFLKILFGIGNTVLGFGGNCFANTTPSRI